MIYYGGRGQGDDVDRHTGGVAGHVNNMVAGARARGRTVTAVDIDGNRFTLTRAVSDGVMVRGFSGEGGDTGRYCRRWREEVPK